MSQKGAGPSMNPRSLAGSRPLSTRLLSAAVPWLLAATACAPPAPAAPTLERAAAPDRRVAAGDARDVGARRAADLRGRPG